MAIVVAVTFKLYRVWFQTMCQQQGEAWAPNNSHTSQPSTPASGAIKQPHTCAPWFALVDLEGVVAALLPLLTISWP
jgi:hypothetical protein